MMHIVLVEPEIPQNTGNIARTCAATDTELILCGPLGFSLEDKYLKRAGMDYFHQTRLAVYPSFEAFVRDRQPERMFFATKKAPRAYTEIRYEAGDHLVFGRESRGLDQDLIQREWGKCIRIPMLEGVRSLNLAVSAAVVLYEALRSMDFPGLEKAWKGGTEGAERRRCDVRE